MDRFRNSWIHEPDGFPAGLDWISLRTRQSTQVIGALCRAVALVGWQQAVRYRSCTLFLPTCPVFQYLFLLPHIAHSCRSLVFVSFLFVLLRFPPRHRCLRLLDAWALLWCRLSDCALCMEPTVVTGSEECIAISPQMVPLSQLVLLGIRALQKLEDAAEA